MSSIKEIKQLLNNPQDVAQEFKGNLKLKMKKKKVKRKKHDLDNKVVKDDETPQITKVFTRRNSLI